MKYSKAEILGHGYTSSDVLSQNLDDWFLINHLTCNDLQDTSTLVGEYKTSKS